MNTPKTIEELLKWLEQTVKDNNMLNSGSKMAEILEEHTNNIAKNLDKIQNGDKEHQKLLNEIKEYQEKIVNLKREMRKVQNDINKEDEKNNRLLERRNQYEKEGCTFLDKIKAKYEDINESTGNTLTKFKKGFDEIKASGNKFLEPWAKADKAASAYAKSIGMSGTAMKELRYETLKFISSSDIAIKFNKSAEELLRIQQSYSTAIGRNISLSNKQKESFAALSAVIGDDMAVRLSTQMENFGLSADEAGKRVTAIFNDSSEKGIAFETYAKNFADNIKIAQNYTFKEGLKGLAAMVEKSVAIKLNLSQATALADKVSTVEGAIKTASQLQVLGGPFAAYSNPLAMMYEGLNDVGKLQDRIVSMYGNLGSFNYETGEMEVSAFNKMRIKKAAEAMGLDYSNVMESINAQGKRNAMGGILDNTGLTKSQKEFLYNKATFQDGQWGVAGLDGKFRSLSELTKGGENNPQLTALINENKSEAENIADIAELLRSWQDVSEGGKKQIENARALQFNNIGEAMKATYSKLMEIGWAVHAIALSSAIGAASGVQRMFGGAKGLTGGVNSNTLNGYTKLKGGWYRNNKTGKTIQQRADGTWWEGAGKNAKQVKAPKLKGGLSTAAKLGTGLALGAASYGLDAWQNNRIENNNFGGTTALGVGSSALTGASIGMMFGPWGALVGGAIGAGVSLLSNSAKKEIEQQLGINLNGRYSEKEYQAIASVNSYGLLDSSLKEKIKNNGDDTIVKGYYSNRKGYANGGILSGPSHANGGMPILGSNQVVEGGEFVINKESTRRHFNELQKINSETNNITPIEPLGKTLKVIENVAKSCESTQNNTKNNKIQVEPININFNGTIRLDTGKQNIDITKEIRENPQLLREITNMITKQININMNGAFNKDTFRQKYI